MNGSGKIKGVAEAWESGQLGMDVNTALVAQDEVSDKIDQALGLEAIQIRLPTNTIESFRQKAAEEGVSMNALIRKILISLA